MCHDREHVRWFIVEEGGSIYLNRNRRIYFNESNLLRMKSDATFPSSHLFYLCFDPCVKLVPDHFSPLLVSSFVRMGIIWR